MDTTGLVYHPPPLFRFVSYVSPDTTILAGPVGTFKYISDTEVAAADENSTFVESRQEFMPYSRSRAKSKSRASSSVQLPVTDVNTRPDSRAIVRLFGYKNVHELIVIDLKTQEEHAIVASKKQNFLTWRGGYERLQNIRKGTLLVIRGGTRAVVKSNTPKGYLPVNEVLLRDNRAYLANSFVCSNVVCYKKKKPTISYGIIGYRNRDLDNGTNGLQFLLIRRKHTMGFMDLIRGRFYHQNMEDMVRVYLSEMTREERHKLSSNSFDELWDEIWANHKSKSYRNEYLKAKRKFAKVPFHLTQDVPCKYEVPEYGFPKGRKNKREDCVTCAMREFEEETGVRRGHYTIMKSAPVFEEKFIATNGAEYCHIYYLARIDDTAPTPTIDSHTKQLEEIGSVEWRTPQECKELFRPYDTSKKQVADDVFNYLGRLV